MLPFHGFVHKQSTVNMLDGGESILSSGSKPLDRKSTDAHKEAERRRRQRINNHLNTLRSLLPNTTKTDKASLLAEVVNHLRELGRKAAAAAAQHGLVPGESDELTLSYCDSENKMIKVILCCEDRPGLNGDLIQVIQSVRAKPVKAEMTAVGGRTKIVVMMQCASGGGEEEIEALKRALMAIIDNGASSGLIGSKRARFYGSIYEGCASFEKVGRVNFNEAEVKMATNVKPK